MPWLRRTRGDPPPAAAAPDPASTPFIERASAGLAAFFENVSEDRSHAVLDLGLASGSSLAIYSRYARWVRFADLLGASTVMDSWSAALRALPPNPQRPYDLVVAWDILDRLPAEQRPLLVERLAAITATDARLFLVAISSAEAPPDLLRFMVTSTDRMEYARTGEPHHVRTPLLPAEVNRLVSPFQVLHGYSTQIGLREYVALRKVEP